jgi:hypothetical protein
LQTKKKGTDFIFQIHLIDSCILFLSVPHTHSWVRLKILHPISISFQMGVEIKLNS